MIKYLGEASLLQRLHDIKVIRVSPDMLSHGFIHRIYSEIIFMKDLTGGHGVHSLRSTRFASLAFTFSNCWRERDRRPQRKVERQAKVLIQYLAIFFLTSQQEISADIIQNSAVVNFSPKTEGTKTKAARYLFFSDVFSLPVHFEFFAVFSYCLHFAKFVCLLKRLQRLKQEWQKSPTVTRQTYGKNQVWFGEIERKLAKLSKTTFTYRSSS